MNRNQDSILGLACLINDALAQAIRPTLAELGISSATFDLLSAIHASDGRESQAIIGSRLGLSRATISEAITACTAAGLVERAAHPSDGRSKVLTLTPAGHRVIQAVLAKTREVERVAMALLKEKEQQQIALALRKIALTLSGIES